MATNGTALPSLMGAVLALTAGVVAGSGTASAQSQRWEFDRERGGGSAQICSEIRRQRVCAVVYCSGPDKRLQVGITGWEPRGRGDEREGEIEVDGRGPDVTFVRDRDRIVGEVWRVKERRATPRLIEDMKSGRVLAIDIAARGPDYKFPLNNSYNTITELEERCEYGDRRDWARRDDNDGAFIFGSDKLGFQIRIGGRQGIEVRKTGDRDRGRDRVALRGKKTVASDFGARWELVESNSVDRRNDRDVIRLGKDEGRYDAIRFSAENNDVILRSVTVKYGNGSEENLKVNRRLREGDDTNILELSGRKGRFIDRITMEYGTVGRGPRAKVAVWARNSGNRKTHGTGFGPAWEKIASKRTNRTRDRDTFNIRENDRYDALRLRVIDNGVEVHMMQVKYGNGKSHEVDVKRRIHEGTSTDPIDLRGEKGRKVVQIILVTETFGNGPRAEVEIWGRRAR